MISDSKAVKHVHTTMNAFDTRGHVRMMLEVMTGPGLITVEGDAHRRQRRIMQPAFGIAQLKALFPVFIRNSQHVCDLRSFHAILH
jgi:cytochrome P450